MSETLLAIGKRGALIRASYDAAGVLIGVWGPAPAAPVDVNAPPYTVHMGLSMTGTVTELDGAFKGQRLAAFISKRLLDAAGWTQGRPTKGDLVIIEGQTSMIEHVLDRGFDDDLLYYCQCFA